MRKSPFVAAMLIMIAGSAAAADLPARKEAPAPELPPQAFSWTGFYVGAQGGIEWAQEHGVFADSAFRGISPYEIASTGGLIGGHVGYNWQFNQIVIGAEGDLNAAGLTGVTSTVYNSLGVNGNPVGVNPYPIRLRQSWTGDLRARIGYAADRALFYVAGGAAFGDVGVTYYTPSNMPPSVPYVSTTTQRVGWTLGGGVEYAFTNAISARVEYRYTDLGTQSFVSLPHPLGHDTADRIQFQSNALLVGLTYHFSAPAPLLASY